MASAANSRYHVAFHGISSILRLARHQAEIIIASRASPVKAQPSSAYRKMKMNVVNGMRVTRMAARFARLTSAQSQSSLNEYHSLAMVTMLI